MPSLHSIHIENFRCLKKFDHVFKQGLTCIIGRGDSGKTTILDAISYVLSPAHTLIFSDSDFYNGQVDHPIIIEATIRGLNDEILRKFGSHIRGIHNGEIISDMMNPNTALADCEEAVTIRLTVKRDLEPLWTLEGEASIEPKTIRASERELFNCFYISDYNDRHFTLSRGTPLNSLFRQKAGKNKNIDILDAGMIAEIGRNAKDSFKSAIQGQNVFEEVINAIKDSAADLGLSSDDVTTSIDQRELLLRDNKISLHSDNIPLRQKGKGTKRLLSLAIQMAMTDPSGIILIDEIEQGLEPDRVQHIVRTLSQKTGLQIIMTTHSSNAIVELKCEALYVKRFNSQMLINIPPTNEMQATVRKNPEAFFAKRILVCEGATEVGLVRGLNQCFLESQGLNISYFGVRYADGGGNSMADYLQSWITLGYGLCLFCDSDVQNINELKQDFRNKGVYIADCQEGFAFEEQLFQDLPWQGIIELIHYHLEDSGKNQRDLYNDYKSSNNHVSIEYKEDSWLDDSSLLRTYLGKKSKSEKDKNGRKGWFKRIDHAEFISSVIFKYFDGIPDDAVLKQTFNSLINWIKKEA